MIFSYLIIIGCILFSVLVLDFLYTRILLRNFTKLLVATSFLYVIFLFRIYMGIKMDLWEYGSGILGIYFFSVPFEEYIFMLVAPYATIVLWEAFHKAIKRK